MKTRLLHPLWTHIPAFGALVFIIVYTIVNGPYPATAATHFDFHGTPNDWGSPYISFWITVGVSLLFIGLTVLFDEMWARQEKRKRFNWFSLFDELFVGFLVGMQTGYVRYLNSGANGFDFPWAITLIIVAVLLLAATGLDMLRPFRAQPYKAAFADTTTLEKDITEKVKHSESFLYWESQNPWWVSFLAILVTAIMLVAAVFAWFVLWWVSLVLIASLLPVMFMYGGLQVKVTREEITVGFGMLSTKVLKLKTDEIANIELMEFSPIADFGGYGIRFGKGMTAYYMRGTRGVKFTTLNGKKYLIGSDKPEELYAVAQAVAGRGGGKA